MASIDSMTHDTSFSSKKILTKSLLSFIYCNWTNHPFRIVRAWSISNAAKSGKRLVKQRNWDSESSLVSCWWCHVSWWWNVIVVQEELHKNISWRCLRINREEKVYSIQFMLSLFSGVLFCFFWCPHESFNPIVAKQVLRTFSPQKQDV